MTIVVRLDVVFDLILVSECWLLDSRLKDVSVKRSTENVAIAQSQGIPNSLYFMLSKNLSYTIQKIVLIFNLDFLYT